MNEKELKKPTHPKRIDFYSDKQYLEAITNYKRQRRQWINSIDKKKTVLESESISIRKERKKYRTMKDTQFRKEQEAKIKQREL